MMKRTVLTLLAGAMALSWSACQGGTQGIEELKQMLAAEKEARESGSAKNLQEINSKLEVHKKLDRILLRLDEVEKKAGKAAAAAPAAPARPTPPQARPGRPDPTKTYAIPAMGTRKGPKDALVTIVEVSDYQ